MCMSSHAKKQINHRATPARPHNKEQNRQHMHIRQLIILSTLLVCSSSSALLADSTEAQRSPWAQHFIADSYTLQPTPSDAASTHTNKTRPSAQQLETHEFNQAFEQLKAAKYTHAIEAFEQFIQRYPQSERRGEAHYWIGEAQYLAKNYQLALDQFAHIIIYFADNEFARQALLKSADSYRAMQNIPQAKLFYKRVIKNHPNTSYAVKAANRLRQLQQKNAD